MTSARDAEARRLMDDTADTMLAVGRAWAGGLKTGMAQGLRYADRLCRLAHVAARAQRLVAVRYSPHRAGRANHLAHAARVELECVMGTFQDGGGG